MIVLDASAALELLLNTETGKEAAERIASPLETLHAPHLIDLEIAQALRRYVGRAIIEEDRARLALDHLAELDLLRYPHEPLLGRIWKLRANFTAYDAAYLSLAEALDATLLTCDARLAQAPGATGRCELLGL